MRGRVPRFSVIRKESCEDFAAPITLAERFRCLEQTGSIPLSSMICRRRVVTRSPSADSSRSSRASEVTPDGGPDRGV
jgi:hypothetical protein